MIHRILNRVNDKTVFIMLGTLIPLFILLPVFRVTANFFEPNSLYYATLFESNALYQGVLTTIELIVKVALFSSILGFVPAYILTFYNVKLKKIFNILFIIPLGIPVYVAAYTYSNIFYHLPFLELILRSDFMMNGAVFIYSSFLYPYVYIASKSYLNKNLTVFIEASKTLGLSKLRTFFQIILPLSRPVIIGSVLFSLFETLSDFAVVEFYGVLTLSRYINLAWFSNGDFISASKFSVYVLFIMFVFIFTERFSRGRKRYANGNDIHKPITKEMITVKNGFLIYFVLIIIIVFSSILPVSQMIVSVVNNTSYISRLDVFLITWNSFRVTIVSIVLIVFFALLLTTITIHLKGVKKHLLSTISTIGYVVPSMVLALGIYLIYIRFDQWLYHTFKGFGLDVMIVTSTILIIVIAFFIKFFSIAYSNFLSAYGKVDKSILESSETLGESKISTLFFVTIPLLKRNIIAVSIILFIDMFKELTLVYSLRPFNFKTLSTEVYRYAGNEMINIAAFPSLIIIVVCTVLIIYLEEGLKK